MVSRVQRDHKATEDPQDFQEQMVPQDLKDTQDLQEHQERVERWEVQEAWDQWGYPVHQDPLDLRATQVFQAHLALLVKWLRVSQVQWVPLEFQVPEVKMVSLALLVPLVHLDHQARLFTMRRACLSSPTRL